MTDYCCQINQWIAVTSLDLLNNWRSFMDLYDLVIVICNLLFPLPEAFLFPFVSCCCCCCCCCCLPGVTAAWMGSTVIGGTQKVGTILSEKLMAAGGASGVKGMPPAGVLAVVVSGVFAVRGAAAAEPRLFIEKD